MKISVVGLGYVGFPLACAIAKKTSHEVIGIDISSDVIKKINSRISPVGDEQAKKDIKEIIKKKPPKLELILTGRYCPDKIIALADLVTEMKEIKHYLNKGLNARPGIDY